MKNKEEIRGVWKNLNRKKRSSQGLKEYKKKLKGAKEHKLAFLLSVGMTTNYFKYDK